MPNTLSIDIGGTGIKGSVLGESGAMMVPEIRIATPHPATPIAVVAIIEGIAEQLPAFDRISAGFPGVVRDGHILTAPNLGTEAWRGFHLAGTLTKRLGKPARILNDSEVQGLGVITGKGLECVLTLGTGIGSSIFKDGKLCPHLELGQHPVHKDKTYDHYLGDAVLKAIGKKRWNKRLERVIGIVHTLLNYDLLHLGGGNAAQITLDLPANVKRASNLGGITGGVRLWDLALDEYFKE